MKSGRTYELKRRAERQEETRRRIIDAAVELHSTLGPSRTTVQGIAEKAGVTRPTVYAHFPDERTLFHACSGHVAETTPPPDPTPWGAIGDPSERLGAALRALYGYYESQEQLLANVQRDVALMPVVAEIDEYRIDYLAGVRELMLEAWPARRGGRVRLRRAVGHALEFSTWQSLVRRNGSTTEEAVRLMLALASAAASER